MLYAGLLFIFLGIYVIVEEIYDIKLLIKEGKFVRKTEEVDYNFLESKIIVGIFSIVVGIFSLLNYFS